MLFNKFSVLNIIELKHIKENWFLLKKDICFDLSKIKDWIV